MDFSTLIGRRRLNRGLVAGPVAAALGAGTADAEGRPSADRRKNPVEAMDAFLNGIHFYADDMGRQVEANHFCTHLTEDLHQCVIFDAAGPGARLIGVEYIVSEQVFRNLPDDEKPLWHSHNYEVKSGQLIAPGLPDAAEHALMRGLATTYGKTWHFWQTDRDPGLPLGIPQLMMGFTADGQAEPAIMEGRDRRFAVSSAGRRTDRADIPALPAQAGANAWRSGRTLQLTLREVPVRNLKR